MCNVNLVQVTEADRAIDVPAMLQNTVDGILALEQLGATVPPEAHELAGVLRRCVVAERELESLRHSTFH